MNNIKTFGNFKKQDIFVNIINNDIQSLKNYINSGHDLNIENNYGYTPLMYACVYNKIEVIELLLKHGVDVNKQTIYGETALFFAYAHGNNSLEIIKMLLDAGADINKQNYLNETILIRISLLSIASSENIKIIEFLLNSGADIDKQDNNGDTALTSAAYKNNRGLVELLLKYNADEFILNNDDESFYDLLNDENKQYFLKEYPTSVYNAIYHNYKKSFTAFVKDYNIKK